MRGPVSSGAMSRLRLLAFASAAAIAVSALADDTPGERYWKLRLPKVERAAAARLWEAAEKARAASLFRFAREEARRVLDLDADNAKARAFLGYVKRGDAWEVDLAQSGKTPTENAQTPVGPKLADAESAWRTLAAKADLDVAAMYVSLGDECAAHSFRVEADEAYRKALAIDADDAAAHKGLGETKIADGLWISPDANRAIVESRIVRTVVEADRYDDLLGGKLNKAETAHFRVESPHDQKEIAAYLDGCEQVYGAYLADLGLGPDTDVFTKPRLYCVLETDAQWDAWVNHVVQYGHQGFYRNLMCHLARDRGVCAVRNFPGATDEKRKDRLMHESVHFMNYALWDVPDGCWLDDALAYRYPILLSGTSSSFCLAPHKEDYGKSGADRDWSDPSMWRQMLKEMVAKKDDAELRLVVTRSAYELPIVASVKAWSVVDFLLRRDRAAFVAMLRDLKGAKSFADVLETRYGKSVEALDDEWRRWVAATY